ncbi:hypothetical protein BP5796_13133 [Coleophoma crateriformis]|uniref:Uncharacterized protein n=1 Tax=Coleophoma crateriformis TaxID=565419 RepID=A0A3D8Q3R7_9HELO|nr:hypothetical protein BP5796_13133 [Coleophoma crateriformis]
MRYGSRVASRTRYADHERADSPLAMAVFSIRKDLLLPWLFILHWNSVQDSLYHDNDVLSRPRCPTHYTPHPHPRPHKPLHEATRHSLGHTARLRVSTYPARKGILGLGRLSELAQSNKEGRTPRWFVERFNELGDAVHTFRAFALEFELVVTRDPENARAVFAANARDFEISPHRNATWSPLLGDGILTAQGENWKHSLRGVAKPSAGGVSSAEGEGKQDSGCSYHLDAGRSCLYRKGLFGRWGFLCYSPSVTRHYREGYKFVDELVVKRLNRPSIKPSPDPDRFVLLDQLAKSSQNPLELRNETLQILNAGRDTTGALLGWAFYFLARSDRVFTKLREIVIADFGQDEVVY